MIVDEEQRFGVQAEGAAAPAAPERRRAGAVGDADPAHAPDVARRPARHLGDRDAARGPAADPHLRRRLRRRPREGRDRARAGARRPGLLPARPRRGRSRRRPSACARWCPAARVAVAHGQMDSAELEQAMMDFLRGDVGRAGLDHDHRVGARHPAGEHADRRARRPARARAALPDPRPGRPLARARVRLPALPVGRGAAAARPRRGWRRSPTTPSSAPGSRSRCATWRSAAPATCSAPSSRVTSRRSASSSTCRCSTRRCSSCAATATAAADDEAWEPVRLDVPVDAYVPRRLHPLRGREDRRAPPDRGRARAGRPGRDRRGAGGPLRPDPGAGREPRAAPGGAHQARPRRARAPSSSARAGSSCTRSSSTPARRARCASEVEGAVYESLKRTLRVPSQRRAAGAVRGRGAGRRRAAAA